MAMKPRFLSLSMQLEKMCEGINVSCLSDWQTRFLLWATSERKEGIAIGEALYGEVWQTFFKLLSVGGWEGGMVMVGNMVDLTWLYCCNSSVVVNLFTFKDFSLIFVQGDSGFHNCLPLPSLNILMAEFCKSLRTNFIKKITISSILYAFILLYLF